MQCQNDDVAKIPDSKNMHLSNFYDGEIIQYCRK
jgi:hypothetical protein